MLIFAGKSIFLSDIKRWPLKTQRFIKSAVYSLRPPSSASSSSSHVYWRTLQSPMRKWTNLVLSKGQQWCYTDCTLWDGKANKGKETPSIRARFSVMFVLQETGLECSSCQSDREYCCPASADTTWKFSRKSFHLIALWAQSIPELI